MGAGHTAVQADEGLDPRVWILDGNTMTVSSRPVTIGRMSGNRDIEVRKPASMAVRKSSRWVPPTCPRA